MNAQPMNARPLPPSCYRHPDRETRISCSRCGRPVCIECLRPADVGQHCPECAAELSSQPSTGSTGPERAPGARRLARRAAPLALGILGVNVAIHLAGMALGLYEALFLAGAQFNAAVAQGEWHRLLTAAFLHSPALTHILFNMYALYLFGPQIEREFGSVSFAGLYVASALAGGAAYYASGSLVPAVGASGAIFGLFGAWLAAMYRNRHTPRGREGLRSLLTLLAINAALPLIVPGIAWEAHVGGLVAGFAIMLSWLGAAGPRPAIARITAALAVAAVAVGTVMLA